MSELQRIDREVRKVIVENGGKHPAGSSALLYLPRGVGGRGMKSVETVYKVTKIKTALKIHGSTDPTVKLVKNWDENSASKVRHSVLAVVVKYVREFGLDLDLTKPNATCQVARTGDEIIDNEVPDALKKAITSRLQQEVMDQKWQGKITAARWEDQDLSLKECYTWLKGWKAAPTHKIAGIEELHQQLLPTKIYHHIRSCVINNGTVSDYCNLERGVRQGDPLSPYPFILAVETLASTLAISIRSNVLIKGITIGNEETKLLQYADDTTAVLSALFDSLDVFEYLSGLKVHDSKTEGLWIGSLKYNDIKPFGIKWPDEPIKALGAFFTYDQNLIYEKIFQISRIKFLR